MTNPKAADEARSFDPFTAFGDKFTIAGDVFLNACPVCESRTFAPLWKLPQNKLSKVAYLDAPDTTMNRLYLAYLPLLTVPQKIYCFDICADCESIFLNPKSDDQAVYERDTSKVQSFRTEGVEGFRGTVDSVRKWIPEDAEVIVDAACGAGQALAVLREERPGLRYIGLELSRPSVEFMRDELGFEAHAVDLDRDDLDSAVAPESVDFVLLEEAFEHVRSPMVVMAKMARMLKPGGRMHFTAQRYGDNELPIRVGEPIYINDETLDWVIASLGLETREIVKDIKFRVIVEKPIGGPRVAAVPRRAEPAAAPQASAAAPAPTLAPTPNLAPTAAPAAPAVGREPIEAVKLADPDADAVNRIAVRVLEARAAQMGDIESGLYEYYRALLERGLVLQDFEIRLADAILAATPDNAPIVEVGAGVGVLAAYLAAKGRKVITFEHDVRRHATTRAFLDALAEEMPAAMMVELRHEAFPAEGVELPTRAVALFTNIVTTMSVEQRDAVLAAIAPFSWVVFDAQRFFFRHAPGGTMPTLQAFWATGFRRMRPLVDLGQEAEYYFVEGPAASPQS